MKSWVALCFWLSAQAAFSQGTLVYNNRVAGSVVAPVFFPDPANPTALKTGNRPQDTPSGTQTYLGAPLTGANWVAVLYAGPLGTPDLSLSLVPNSLISFRTGNAAGFIVVTSRVLPVPGIAEGQSARLQMRVYDTSSGSSWGTALNRGASQSFDSLPLGGLEPPPNLIGLTAFNVSIVPEPSSLALAAGTLLVLLARRTRQPWLKG